ncbi:MAG: N-acetylmuramoyl-L-alanine amidase [Deltaproteobacteria bacterium]|nr:N-acetylmuramoyl-L-alanine amidase [Deltaproteobacteria bacterium]
MRIFRTRPYGRWISLFAGLCLAVATSAQARPNEAIRRAEALERTLSKNPEKLKQRRNIEPVIKAWEEALKNAKGTERVSALEGLARALETLARWSGRNEDRALAKKARARFADTRREAPEKPRGPGPALSLSKGPLVTSNVRPTKPARPVGELAALTYALSGSGLVVPLRVPADTTIRTEELPEKADVGLRFVVDLAPMIASRSALKALSVGHAGVASLRVGQLDRDTVRVVVELERGVARPETLELSREDGARIVVRSSSPDSSDGASPTPDIPSPEPKAPEVDRTEPEADTGGQKPADLDPRGVGARAAAAPGAVDRSDVLVRQQKEEAARGLDALVRELTAKPNSPVPSEPKALEPASEDDAPHFTAALPPLKAAGLHKRTREALRPRPADGLVRVRRVVVDAGHGGKDTGAISKRGLFEKDVNLSIAKELEKELRAIGIEVVMTRSTDEFVSLPERTAIATRADADLFVSVHSNANRNRRIQGVETYFLNTTSNRYASRLAQRENSAGEGGDVEVDVDPDQVEDAESGALPPGPMGQDIRLLLADLAMRSATEESRRLAGVVQGSIVESLQKRGSKITDLGVKNALFFVLLGVRMPSILIESGFVTNPDEEARLSDPGYRRALAKSIAAGVYRYARERENLAAN